MIDEAAMAAEAERLLRVGEVEAAEKVCRVLLRARRDHVTALMILGVLCMAQERWDEAEALLERGCAAHPGVVGFQAALGQLRLRLNQDARAIEPLENCVLLDPATPDHRIRLLNLYQTRVFAGFSAESKLAMLICLADESLTHSLMHRAWLSLLRADPEARGFLDLFDGAVDYPSFRERVERTPALLRAVRDHELLQRGLERFLAADTAIERGLTFVRRWFLEHRQDLRGFLPMLCSLARYCFFTEYVFTVEEDPAVLGDDPSTPEAAALLGCYQPLAGHPRAEAIARLADEACYRNLMRTLVWEPREEHELELGIPTLTPISDEVSRAVRKQYEENPYPRWTTVGGAGTETSAGDGGLGSGRTILMAGCGTGREAAEVASKFPAAHVDAVDLSRASLAYGVRQAQRLKLANLSFGQADILNIDQLAKPYDLIVAVGVLHHMRDPRAGLRALVGVLRAGGILRIALYSTLARAAVVEARAWIQAAGFPATPEGIRGFRAAIVARPLEDPVRAWLVRSYDFYSLSQCRDLVFHVHEQTFTLPQIAEILGELGLSVMRVDTRSPIHRAAYRARFPDDPAATNLASWHQLEQDSPTMFAGMYSLWLCRTAETGLVDAGWLGAGESPFG